MNKSKSADVLILQYGDPVALMLLWQKALFIVPIWAFPIVPIVALFCRLGGADGVSTGFGVLLAIFVCYFLEDVLKRKIRVDASRIFFGFRTLPIRDIISVEIINKKKKLLPGSIAIIAKNGNRLKFKLDGLSDESVRALLNHLKSHNSDLKISPVLESLVKFRRAPELPLVIPDRLEINYQLQPVIIESVSVFRTTLGKWMRIGPLIACIWASALWLPLLANLYLSLQPSNYDRVAQLAFLKFVSEFTNSFWHHFGKVGSYATSALSKSCENPVVAASLIVGLLAIFFYLQKTVWKPNRLVLSHAGIAQVLKLGALCIPLKKTNWSAIQAVKVNTYQDCQAAINLETGASKPVNLNLAAINMAERNLLLSRIQHFVPECEIQHQATQLLTAGSDRSYTELWLQSLSSAPERSSLDPLEPGQFLGNGRFEVLHSLGVGGQGTAYLCKQTGKSSGDNNDVVLKETILPIFSDPLIRRKNLESFEQEAKLLQSLEHRGIVKLVDYFIEDHRAYLVLEHLKGINLRQLVARDGLLEENRALDLAKQMCDILAFLHERSIVHRDFTPENLIIDFNDQIRLIDFNVAQQTQSGATGAIAGKPSYMPPEQFRSKSTEQSDIYAMGCTLYFLLTGSDPEPLSQSMVREKNADISVRLNEIISTATALSTDKRYKSIDLMHAALDDQILLAHDTKNIAIV